MTTTEPHILSDDEILDRLQANEKPADEHEFIRPFSEAGDRLIDWMANDDNRFMLGLPKVDAMVRGIGRGELCYVIGRPHSGKTQVVLQSIVNNPHKKVLFFTPDENDVLLLTKLIAMTRGINVIELEKRLKQHDPEAEKMVHEVASQQFKNLFVIDRPLTFAQMTKAANEARELWGSNGDVVVGDFLELFPGAGGEGAAGVVAVSQMFKSWLKHEDMSGIILHQSSRSSGERGKAGGMDAMRYGGESDAIYVLEVFRERDRYDLSKPDEMDQYDRVKNTVTVNVAKNKRPPSQTGECVFHMDPNTGVIKPLDQVLPTTGLTKQEDSYDEPF